VARQPLQIVHLWSLEEVQADQPDLAQLEAAQQQNCGSVLHLMQAAGRTELLKLQKVWLVTQGAQPVTAETDLAIQQAPLWGLGRVLALEDADVWGGLVDLDPASSVEQAATLLISQCFQPHTEDALAFRGMQPYVARLVRSPLPSSPQPLKIQTHGTYLITGGLGALGLQVARWLVEQGARHLLLLSRRSASDAATLAIQELQQAGAQVQVAAVDIANPHQLRQILTNVSLDRPLRGIIHAAGVLEDGVLLRQTWEQFANVLEPKLNGAWNLHHLSQDYPIDFFVMFSSIASLIGSAGQSNYAAANAFLDALAHYRQRQGLPALSINWGPWAASGMAAELDSRTQHRWSEANGVGRISSEQGLHLLEHLLKQSRSQVGVIPIAWDKFLKTFAGKPPLLLKEFVPEMTAVSVEPAPKSTDSNLLQQLEAVPLNERRDRLVAAIQAQVVKVLRLDDDQPLDPNRPLQEMGMDSLMAIELRSALSLLVSRTLPTALIFDYSTITALTDYLGKSLGCLAAPEAALTPASAPPLESRQSLTEAIAVIGMSCRFPGAENLEAFWQLLQNGVDAIREIPLDRWNVDEFYDPDLSFPGTMNTRWGGFLDGLDQFDPYFFGISASEARSMDPQQRLLLEVSWEALERSGYPPDRLVGSQTGVFTGISTWDYFTLQLEPPPRGGTGMALSIAANRLSYLLDLRGPSMAVDTACSSSLVAVDLACQSLRNGHSDLALASGVNIILSPITTIACSQAGMMASDGHCKTFDQRADGYVRGEGCGVVVLKRLSDALKDGDNILAVLRGSAVNQDGRSNGLTAPNGLAQQAVIRQALRQANVQPSQISYVEAHGTGTPLGDAIEVESLWTVLQEGRSADQPCWIGSVKTNVGHLEAAAGIAGLIKLVLSLSRELIPPHLNLQHVNPALNLEQTQIQIPRQQQCWARRDRASGDLPRLAGISSFGFGGTNVHVIVEEAPLRPLPQLQQERPQHIFTLSAKSDSALRVLIDRYQQYLRQNLEQDSGDRVADLCYTANVGRSHFAHRLIFAVDSQAELQATLTNLAVDAHPPNVMRGQVDLKRQPKVAFCFPGEGSVAVGMGRQLYETHSGFRQMFDRCDHLLKPELERSLLSLLFAESSASSDRQLHPPLYSQPAAFAIGVALAQLWRNWGIQPSVVLGEGVGEYVAAWVAGVFSLEAGLQLVMQRAKLMQAEGWQDAEAQSLKSASFEQVTRQIEFTAPQMPLISTVTDQPLETGYVPGVEHWLRHLRSPRMSSEALQSLVTKGCEIVLEMGASGSLSQSQFTDSQLWLSSLAPQREDWSVLLPSLMTLYVRGVNINWQGFEQGYERRRVVLPTYPFEHKRYWLDPTVIRSFSRKELDLCNE
jgi:acyl transferase domain-containing protein/acyl carrier protein